MKPLSALTARLLPGALSLLVLSVGACITGGRTQPAISPPPPAPPRSSETIVASGPRIARPPFAFSADDERFLDEVQRGAFNFLWNAASPESGMVYDRTSKPVVSVAGVGFQLSAIPIGIRRGWITADEGHARTIKILRALAGNPDNRKAGLFFHYLDPATSGPGFSGYEVAVSTIDSALLFAGVLTVSSYFGGDVAEIGDALFRDADFSFFITQDEVKPYERGFVSLGWKPDDPAKPTGDGKRLPYAWVDAGDEHRLVTFLGVCAPKAQNRLDPRVYYRLRRRLGQYEDTGPFAWFPWSGALFTNFFAHCWINYAGLGPDDPGRFGIEHRARIDWWENSRRATLMHRRKCTENPLGLPTFGAHAWGVSASDTPDGYAVPGLFPDPIPMPGATPEFDYPTAVFKDNFGDGTVAPYAPGSTIMFDPGPALDALRYARSLKGADGSPLVWHDPNDGRGYGFQDAYNLGKQWSAPDCVAIDQGPLILAIENARTGFVWQTFMSHGAVRDGLERLGMKPDAR